MVFHNDADNTPAPPPPPTYVPTNSTPKRSRIWITSGIILAILVIITAVVLLTKGTTGDNDPSGNPGAAGTPSASPTEQETQPEQPSGPATPMDLTAPDEEELRAHLRSLERRIDGDPVARGPIDAPVVIIGYADFTCPYCGKFELETMPLIQKDYIDQGLVRFEWRDLPLFGEPSVLSAFGGRAAAAQGKFWEYQTAIYSSGVPRDQVNASVIMKIAQDIGIQDMEAFQAGFSSQEFADNINKDYQEAVAIGVKATPTFLINGTIIPGAESYEVFQQVINQALEADGVQVP